MIPLPEKKTIRAERRIHAAEGACAKEQVAGNVYQLWGSSIPTGVVLTLAYAEGNGIMGRILETDGVSPSADLSRAVLDYGRASGPILQSPRLGPPAYAVKGGIRLGDCEPRP